MKYSSLLLFVMISSACSTSSEVNTPGNKDGQSIYCSGSAFSWETCYERATELCGAEKYDVIDKYEDRGAFVAYGSSRLLPDRRLIIQCKK